MFEIAELKATPATRATAPQRYHAKREPASRHLHIFLPEICSIPAISNAPPCRKGTYINVVPVFLGLYSYSPSSALTCAAPTLR
jgi:hypothetical protein